MKSAFYFVCFFILLYIIFNFNLNLTIAASLVTLVGNISEVWLARKFNYTPNYGFFTNNKSLRIEYKSYFEMFIIQVLPLHIVNVILTIPLCLLGVILKNNYILHLSLNTLINYFLLLPLVYFPGGIIIRALTFSINKTLGIYSIFAFSGLALALVFKFSPIIFAGLLLVGTIISLHNLTKQINDPNSSINTIRPLDQKEFSIVLALVLLMFGLMSLSIAYNPLIGLRV